MLSEKQKTKSLPLLKILTTIFIMLAPALLEYADVAVSAYVLMLLAGALFVLRILGTGKHYTSLCHIALSLLWCYGLLSTLWVTNRSVHFVYLSVVALSAFVLSNATDYFNESSDEKASRRMMYMVSIGSVLCAVVNFIYWLTDIVPFGKDESFSRGMGTNHFLAVFMLVGIAVSAILFKGNSKLRKVFFVAGILLMLFVLFYCRSVFAWMLAISFLVILFFKKKSGKNFFAVSIIMTTIFTIALIMLFFLSKESSLFKDVFSYGNLFGKGGGFLSGCETFSSVLYNDAVMPGLMSTLYASSGIIGLLCVIVFVFKSIIHFVKLRTVLSVFNLFLTVMIMLLPFGNSIAVLVLWLGIMAYNEKAGYYMVKHSVNIKPENLRKMTPVIVCAGLVTVVFICQRFMVISADNQLEKGKCEKAYSLYTAAAPVNVLDSGSALGAARAICEKGDIKSRYDEAVSYAQMAQNRDKNNLQCKKLEAKIHILAGKYNLAIEEFTEISSRAKVNYEYNLLLAETLYKIVETSPEGSAETISAYEKIVEIAQKTDNLDYREKINNIADKALVYKRRRTEIE